MELPALALMVAALLATAALVVAAMQLRGMGEDPVGFTESFEGGKLDSEVWETGDHPLGRGELRPRNASLSEGELRLALPAGTLDGGEVNTRSHQEYGSYRARMRVPDSPGSVTGFFLYRPPDYASEVDIEVYNAPEGRMLVTTYAGGDPVPTNSERVDIPFDPTRGFHEYRFDYHPDEVTFYVDGEPVQRFSQGLPERPMRLYINAWYPDWVAGGPLESAGYVRVDRVESPGPVGGEG